jgi:hypothetical protein
MEDRRWRIEVEDASEGSWRDNIRLLMEYGMMEDGSGWNK